MTSVQLNITTSYFILLDEHLPVLHSPLKLPINMLRKIQGGSFLEVERKFCALTVPDLTSNIGNPRFRSIRPLGRQIINDVYFDQSKLLTSASVWVRQRNGRWEAKVKKGGDFQNSRFEELSDPYEIGRCVRAITGVERNERESFGLERIATMSTTRRAWVADDKFKIVLDTMDFGHIVGEIELQSQADITDTGALSNDDQKQRIMQEMDDQIVRFMERYQWAFASGVPKGKLTAYFERETQRKEREA